MLISVLFHHFRHPLDKEGISLKWLRIGRNSGRLHVCDFVQYDIHTTQ